VCFAAFYAGVFRVFQEVSKYVKSSDFEAKKWSG